MSANIASGKIVTDGLLLYVDAGNYKSYTSGSASWIDMANNAATGSVVNSPAFDSSNGGSLVFDGINDYCQFANGGKFNIVNTTWGVWVYTTKSDNETILSAEANTGYGWGFRNRTGGALWWVLGGPGYGNYVGASYGTTNQWFYATGTANATTMKIYINGVQKSQTAVNYTPDSPGPLYVGYYVYPYGPNNYFAGKVSNFHIYDRELSAAEVLQNYKAMRGRFGL
jgi:hypothetical protein